ncbi:MAG: protein translocase subunit SecD [Verrucomicrobia bacterium]|nr:protein translocase subunit SecD [Verrucomicrobiota bacterium]
MNRKNTWKWALVIFIVAWSLWEVYPPTGRNIVEVFQEEAAVKDARFDEIVQRARELQKQYPDRGYQNLVDAVGTNDIRAYFPSYSIAKDMDPTRGILNNVQKAAAGQIRLGLDLRGGTSFLMGVDTSTISTNQDSSAVLSQAAEVLRRRVDKLGVAEPLIQPVGTDRILVQLPGISEVDKETARATLERAAFLELRLVHPNSDELIAQGIIEPGYVRLTELSKDSKPGERKDYLVRRTAELTGKNIDRAMVIPNQYTGKPEIDFVLDTEGAQIFARVTRENVGRQLAIVLDGELYSAPNINEPIDTGRAQISGNFTRQEAWELANILENPLERPVEILEERSVDPSLGKQTIRSGFYAAVGGILIIAIFMLVYYMAGGLVANIALLLNIIVLLGVLCSIDATLTLPGIAGIVLTIGMAVDANVLIFERIREELRTGKSIRGAVTAGYEKAFSTILDANVTTLIASVILINMGTGPVQGFGVTLTIGVAVSMFTALVVTRLMFEWMLSRNLLKSFKMLQLVKDTNINFMKLAKPAFIGSWLLIIVGIGWGFKRGNEAMGIDFAGGDTLTLTFAQKVDEDKLRQAVDELKIGDSLIQYQREISTGTERLYVTSQFDSADTVQQALAQTFPQADFQRVALDKVQPTIGQEILEKAVIAVLLSLFGILLYVSLRYEFSFAIGAIVAVVHDVLMALGWYFLSGRELNATVVAAVLTVIGFSLNDTIVIFDRIREDLKQGVRGTFVEIINKALNQTLARTVITSGTTFLATMSLYIFGGGAINDFAFLFLVGIIVGTYSSIYIAGALVLWWHKGERPKMASNVPMEELAVPAKI